MRDNIIAAVRTGIQALVAGLVAWAAGFDILIDETALGVVLVGIGVSVVTLVLRWLEEKFPWLTPILSLGSSKAGPTYEA